MSIGRSSSHYPGCKTFFLFPSLVLLALFCATTVLPVVPSSFSQELPARVMTVKSGRDHPLAVKEVRNLQNVALLQDLEIEESMGKFLQRIMQEEIKYQLSEFA